jgi:uncharacterized alkaline shock family protein YloU
VAGFRGDRRPERIASRSPDGGAVSLVVTGGQGTITVPEAVLVQIATRAAEQVEGVRVRRRRSVEVEARTVALDVAARTGEPLTVQGERVQEAVAAAMKSMCGLDVAVHVSFEELL